MSSWLKTTFIQATRFGLVGIMNVVINAAIFSYLVYVGVHYLLASAAGAIVGILNSFLWSKFFVFKHKGKALPQLYRTIAVYSMQIAISWAGLVILIELLKINPYMAYAANIAVVTLVSFLGLKHFAFKIEEENPEETR